MPRSKRIVIPVGLLSGLPFYGYGFLPHHLSWPYLWPFVGGGAAVMWIARHRAEKLSVRDVLGIGAAVGALATAIATVVTLAGALYATRGQPVWGVPLAIGTIGIVGVMVFAIPAAIVGAGIARLTV